MPGWMIWHSEAGDGVPSDGHIPRERIPLIFVADLLPQYRRDYTFYIALSFDPPGVWAPHLVFDNPSRAEPGINGGRRGATNAKTEKGKGSWSVDSQHWWGSGARGGCCDSTLCARLAGKSA